MYNSASYNGYQSVYSEEFTKRTAHYWRTNKQAYRTLPMGNFVSPSWCQSNNLVVFINTNASISNKNSSSLTAWIGGSSSLYQTAHSEKFAGGVPSLTTKLFHRKVAVRIGVSACSYQSDDVAGFDKAWLFPTIKTNNPHWLWAIAFHWVHINAEVQLTLIDACNICV